MVTGRLHFESTQATEFIDLSERIRDEIRKCGLSTGRIHLQSLHTTLGLAINENEPLLLEDFHALLERLAPGDAGYQADGLPRRTGIGPNQPGNRAGAC